ncbi:MAG: hypothetical protein JWM92_246 [Candidatus Nomurabacteria bacterium]|nr:hypothetical protein [Candidatus Nomurabacteria bacterium]
MKKLNENQRAYLFIFALYAGFGILMTLGYQREIHNLPQDTSSYIFKLGAISFMGVMLCKAKILPTPTF